MLQWNFRWTHICHSSSTSAYVDTKFREAVLIYGAQISVDLKQNVNRIYLDCIPLLHFQRHSFFLQIVNEGNFARFQSNLNCSN